MTGAASGRGRRRPRRPPARLPRSYHGIWAALAAANEEAPSRQVLARRLGVSTQTLQRILVRGDVPRFPQTRNPRVTRSWARTLARLARALGHDVRQWIEAIGMPGEEFARATSEAARPSSAVRQAGAPAERLPDSLEISIVSPGLLAERPTPESPPFGESLARLLFAATLPDGRLRFDQASEASVVADLAGPAARSHLALGLPIWLQRDALGRSCLPLPGWRVSLCALLVGGGRETSPALRWADVVAPGRPEALILLAGQTDVIRSHLLNVASIEPSRVRIHSEEDLGPGARMGTDVLLADVYTCRKLMSAPGGIAAGHGASSARLLDDAEGLAPAFPIGLSFPAPARSLRALLREGLEREVFGTLAADAARLYAEMLAHEVVPRALRDPFAGSLPRGSVWVEDFPEAGERFLETFCRRVVDQLAGAVLREVGTGPETFWATILAVRLVREVLPARWRGACDRLAEPRSLALGPHCHSCSASLLDPAHRGVSDAYCRFCADERGRLRNRDEVHRLLAGWFAAWQRAVTEEEASRRAVAFMSAMPAWQRN